MPYNPRIALQCTHGHGCGPVCQANDGTREFRVTCLACPLQIEGHVDGVQFYFRARHDRWRLVVTGGHLGADEEIASGDTDEFTEGQAVDLIVKQMSAWIYQPEAVANAGQLP